MFEVTQGGEVCWEYTNPHFAGYKELKVPELESIGFDFPANAVFRAYKYLPEEVPWLQAKLKQEWKSLYRFDLQEQYFIDYEVSNWYVSTHPNSRFVTTLIAARLEPDLIEAIAVSRK